MWNKRIVIIALLFFVFVSFGSVSNSVSAATPTLSQALDDNTLSWSTDSWYGTTDDTHDGVDAAKGFAYRSSTKVLQTVVNGPGTITFYWKYRGYGHLAFCDTDSYSNTFVLSDDDLKASTDWEKQTIHVNSGKHYLQWIIWAGPNTMIGNPFGNQGDTYGYVDQVQWIPNAFKVVATSPKKLTKKASRTSNIYIKFNKNIIKSVNWSKIIVKKNGKKISIKTGISGNKISIKTNKRSKNTYYTVYIPKSAIKDNVGNNFASGYIFKFKTK